VDRPGPVGIGIFGAAAASRDNVISGNASNAANTANIALRFGRITGTLIESNTATGAQDEEQWGAGIVVSDDDGDAAILRTVVRGNRLDENFGGGISVGGSATDTLVERNNLDNSFGPAIESDGDRTLIRRNTITSTLSPGTTLFGIQIDGRAEDNRVELNNIDRPGFIGIDDSGTRTLTTANLIVGQVFPSEPTTGGIAGIIVREEASDGRIQANVVRRHAPGFAEDGDDGIDVESPATTITANVANDNADLGIDAVDGVTDGGGNRASGNGNANGLQCVGVACS
jgi:hypothetical protein